MIFLITAVPGSGKTLYVLDWLKKKADEEQRQVYYSGIPLTDEGKEKLGWLEIAEPKDWHTLPPGAITVIDECQRVFPVRRAGGQVPQEVSAFETHRHKGHDIVLITQHPNLMDSHIRRLVGKHVHLLRIFGMKAAQMLSWDGIQENPNSAAARTACLDKRKFVYPTKVYRWYKSAELHTHKVSIPRRVWFFVFLVVALGLLIPFSLHFVKNMAKGPQAGVQGGQPGQGGASAPYGVAPGFQGQGQPRRPLTAAEYVALRQPRVAGVPESAAVYDEVAKVTDFPHMAACIYDKQTGRCSCYEQQGHEVYGVMHAACIAYAEHGFFDPYLSGDRQREVNLQRGQDRQQLPQQLGRQIAPVELRNQSATLGSSPYPAPPSSDFSAKPNPGAHLFKH